MFSSKLVERLYRVPKFDAGHWVKSNRKQPFPPTFVIYCEFNRIFVRAVLMEFRTLIAYLLIALLVVGAVATARYLRYNSREAVERRQRRQEREKHRKRHQNEA